MENHSSSGITNSSSGVVLKKLPSTLLVSNLKILFHRLFKVDTHQQQLIFKEGKVSEDRMFFVATFLHRQAHILKFLMMTQGR
jgi:hypothetical protein